MRWIFALVLLLAACRPATSTVDPNIVQWDHNPQTIVFRADVIGGESDFLARNDVPNCTIFGDNHLVWVNELGPNQIQVLEDRLPDGAISAFAQYLTVDQRIYTYNSQLATVQQQTNVSPVTETVTLDVNQVVHKADSLSGWNSDWFPNVLKACTSLGQTPVLVAPTGGWVSAQSVPFSTQPPLVTWDGQASGIDFDAIAVSASPVWKSGQGVTQLWTTLHSLPSNVIFQDGTNYFQVALQVPGVTRDAPPAPSS